MKTRLFPLFFALILLVSCRGRDEYVQLGGYAQGGTYAVKLNTKGVKASPAQMQAEVDRILKDIDFSLSGYNKASILSRFNAGERVTPDSLFCRIYELSYGFYEQSGGSFDVSCGPLFDIWGFGFKKGSLPDDETVRETMRRCGMSRLKKDIRSAIAPDGTLSGADLLAIPGDTLLPVLNFNAIAQGFSCDVVAGYLHSLGVRDMLVDIGEIYCEGLNASGKPWSVGIDTPTDGNNTPGADLQGVWHSCGSGGQGVVTSGNYRKFYVSGGRKYSHTIDPVAGRPVDHNLLSATIVAPDAATADAVATWCMVVGLDKAEALVKDMGLECCLIYDEAGQMRQYVSPGFELSTLR